MKKARAIITLSICVLLCLPLSGCVTGGVQNDETEGDKTEDSAIIGEDNKNSTDEPAQEGNKSVMNVFAADATELRAPETGQHSAAARVVAGGANDFAFRLSAALAKDNGNDNFVCSPYSVWIPLAALINATDEQNRSSLLDALSASGISAEDVNNAASRMLYDLTRQRERGDQFFHDPLRIANAIFVDIGVTLRREFAQTFLDFYRGAAINVDFSSKEAVDAVNEWASENTEGLITEIIQEFDPTVVAAIANAIYFSDRWEWEFDPQKSKEDVFHSPDEDTSATFMLREGDAQIYYEDDRVQAMPLRFKTGGGLYIILPKDGDATGLLSTFTSGFFHQIQRDSISVSGKLLLPRFSIESPVLSLANTLTAMGIPLFDSIAAPLTGGLIEEDIPVWLSSAMHKAVIEVDEKGTTAAAVTVIAVSGASPPEPTEPFEMICDRPFVFVLYSHTYDGGNQVLFTGIVNRS